MSVQYDPTRARFVVRWREGGKQRVRRFASEPDAVAFDKEVNPRGRSAERAANPGGRMAAEERATKLTARRTVGPARDGVYAYGTNAGVRWRFVYRQSDGTLSSRRGFTSRKAAADAKRRLLEGIRRGEVRVSRETFGTFWTRVLGEKRPFMTAGSYEDFATHGRKRLVPFFGADRLSAIDEHRVREWLDAMVELIGAGELAPKTVNNARTYLSVVLNEAVRRGHLVRNPCDSIPQLPANAAEVDFLRLGEIDGYLDACAGHYRPLAEFLIGSGARVSESIAVRWRDFDFEHGVVRIYRQRSRDTHGTARTKGKRFRGVQIGPRLCRTLEGLQAGRGPRSDDADWVFLCPRPTRGRYARRETIAPPHRKTVHDWHEAALEDAGLRDMPLHSLRHTAAAAWLATGHPLIFVQRQLGHRSITTTEEHYGHLERWFTKSAAAATERAIAEATRAGRDGLFV